MIKHFTMVLLIGAITTYALTPPTPPPEEPSIPTAPEPQILATSTDKIQPVELEVEEPLPLPKKLEPVPDGIICLEDCQLIDPEVVEAEVRDHFKDVPIMVEIARCESTFRQFDPETGRPLKNPESSATGVLQLMASYHREPAKEMGYDIDTLEGNLAYGEMLYQEQGTTPWNASRTCWDVGIAQTGTAVKHSVS
jgi:hypothetical protein